MAKVLVVDDQAENRALIVTLLEHRGHHALQAADGGEALARVRQERPELVISDILMPTMDGYEFVRQLRADPAMAATDVIFYTAHYHEREARNLARACGVSRVLIKPCEPEDILSAIDQVLAHEAEPAAAPPPDVWSFDREHLRLVSDKLSQNVAELEAASLRMAALTDLNLQLASEQDPRLLLEKVCRGARNLIGARYAVLCCKGKHADETIFCTSGIEPALADRLQHPQIEQGPLGQAMAERRSWRMAHPEGGTTGAGLPAGYPPLRASLTAPVVSLANSYGWILLADKLGAEESREFSAEDEQLLSILAAQAGRIYENGSLYAEVRRHAAQLRLEIAERQRAAEELRGSEQRFRELAENINDVFFVREADGNRMLYVSPAYETIWGRSCESLYHDPSSWTDAIHPDDRESSHEELRKGELAGRFEFDYRIVRPDGAIRYIGTKGFPIHDESGKLVRIAGVATDITEKTRAEERILRLNRVYAVLSSINTLIVRVRDRDELFREACRIAVDAGEFVTADVVLFDADSKQAMLAASSSTDARYLEQQRAYMATVSTMDWQANHGTPLRYGEALVFNDRQNVPALLQGTEIMASTRATCALPLVIAGRTIGAFVLRAHEVGFFDDEEMKLLRELAGDIAFAIDNIEKQERLDYLAYYDQVTGLANRRLFQERVAQYLRSAADAGHKVVLTLIDLERFKSINDSLGRSAGDALLKQVAEWLARNLGGANLVGRLDADHFALVSPKVRPGDDLPRILESRQQQLLAHPFKSDNSVLRIAAKAGVAVFPGDGADAEALLRNAEAALKEAKLHGDRYRFFTQDMAAAVAGKRTLENQLRLALEREEFVLHYQPKVNLATGKLTGAEALIRWNDPCTGLVPPARFIPVLEETGLIHDVGRWALRKASADYLLWVAESLPALRVAVNVSALQLRSRHFVDEVRTLTGVAEQAAAELELEITESLIMEDVGHNIDSLRAIRDLGVTIAIDDFGTGFSSLAYLAKLPVNTLKIDRSFVIDMTSGPEGLALVSTIIHLAHSLNLKVVAEGVETEEQSRILRLLSCDEMQGFLFSKAVPADIFEGRFLVQPPAK